MTRLKEFYCKYKELILYVFFGGLTTLVNWGDVYKRQAAFAEDRGAPGYHGDQREVRQHPYRPGRGSPPFEQI